MRRKMTEAAEWTEAEERTVTRARKRHNKVRRKAHAKHRTNEAQRVALGFPWNRHGIKNEHFHDSSMAGAARAKKSKEEREAERPAWMSDPKLLPKKPPGR